MWAVIGIIVLSLVTNTYSQEPVCFQCASETDMNCITEYQWINCATYEVSSCLGGSYCDPAAPIGVCTPALNPLPDTLPILCTMCELCTPRGFACKSLTSYTNCTSGKPGTVAIKCPEGFVCDAYSMSPTSPCVRFTGKEATCRPLVAENAECKAKLGDKTAWRIAVVDDCFSYIYCYKDEDSGLYLGDPFACIEGTAFHEQMQMCITQSIHPTCATAVPTPAGGA